MKLFATSKYFLVGKKVPEKSMDENFRTQVKETLGKTNQLKSQNKYLLLFKIRGVKLRGESFSMV